MNATTDAAVLAGINSASNSDTHVAHLLSAVAGYDVNLAASLVGFAAARVGEEIARNAKISKQPWKQILYCKPCLHRQMAVVRITTVTAREAVMVMVVEILEAVAAQESILNWVIISTPKRRLRLERCSKRNKLQSRAG